ncbi:MAG TPA: MerR family transcriptional regulator [Bacteroidales bacterium]|nr:MerR family transcriptional regulator [Bacteroidales bacterium]
MMEHPKDKIYYSIGEVANMFGVNQSLIRFWENEFSIIKPRKNAKGTRFFSPADVDNFHLIFHLVKERGYTLAGAKQILREKHKQINEDFELIKRLKNVRSFLIELKNTI